MATTTIKSTYSLDVETVRTLEELASRWNTSKSEVVRRAIKAAAARDESADGPLAALRQLQDSVRSRGVDLDQWVREVRAERRAWTMSPPTHEARGE
ncbi:ribbon-helix-helix protein, CopG family [Candidatus Palauibacter sp.]|uniref:ribbon-helix-helix protein, CopG family n=1 Tax=Candidatus Palauibacter sp. TaxID=3101350 RepID=UPI003B58BAD9